jgi:hypothetical protein
MHKINLYNGQNRPHCGYNGSQERCFQRCRNHLHSAYSGFQANDNVVKADLSDSGLWRHLRDERMWASPVVYTTSRGRVDNYWLSILHLFSRPVESHREAPAHSSH